MFFELNNRTYGVKFHRTNTTTFAELVRVEDDGTLMETNIMGIANLYYKDRFEKSKGRKIALAKLLDQMHVFYLEANEPEHIGWNMTREVRTAIWEEYFKTHKK